MRHLFVLALLPIASCQTPTEMSIELRSDVGYREDMSIAVAVDVPEHVEGASPRVVVHDAWVAGGSLGNIVAVPSSDRDDLAVRVVLATGREPSTCTAEDATGCVVVRRRLKFSRGESTSAQIVIRPACLGVYCDEMSSCAVDGKCGALTTDEATGASVPDGVVEDADPYAAVVLADRPRHYYRLDEPKGATVARDRMGRADGVIDTAHVQLGATGALERSKSTGAFFDGSGAIVVANAESSNGASTIEAWIRSDSTGDTERTVVERVDLVGSSPYGFRLAKPGGKGASFSVFRGERSFEVTAPAMRNFAGYSHVVAVTRGTSIEIYLDADKADPATLDVTATVLIGPLVIGGSRVGSASFIGAIDEVALYDYPLTAEQIARHYAAGAR